MAADSLTADLPRRANEVKGPHAAQEFQIHYCAPPPTPYVAYLRQGEGQVVTNHVVAPLNLASQLRVDSIPYYGGAGWRDLMGPGKSLMEPKMIQLTPQQWVSEEGKTLQRQILQKIPGFMLPEPTEKLEWPMGNKPLKLRAGFELLPMRVVAAPYLNLTWRNGNDYDGFSRVQYHQQFRTVHSKSAPDQHVNLVPFSNRVMTPREKARAQGFPDDHIFCGTVPQQHKQVANSVSPQVAKAIGRVFLAAEAGRLWCLPVPVDSTQAEYKGQMRNFADFLREDLRETDVKSMRCVELMKPYNVPNITPSLQPMTYDELLVYYDTQYRRDNARLKYMTPFEILRKLEAEREYPTSRILGARYNDDGVFQVAAETEGWSHFWMDYDVTSLSKNTAYMRFERDHEAELSIMHKRRCGAFILDGCTVDKEAEKWDEGGHKVEAFDEMEQQYTKDVASKRIFASNRKPIIKRQSKSDLFYHCRDCNHSEGICHHTNPDYHGEFCEECHEGGCDELGYMTIECDACGALYHPQCLVHFLGYDEESLDMVVRSEDEWMCHKCNAKQSHPPSLPSSDIVGSANTLPSLFRFKQLLRRPLQVDNYGGNEELEIKI